jgi:HK97 family phage prohead protease
MGRETKVLPQAIKDITGRTVTGICAVFGNVDLGGDRILPGAFLKTINEGQARWRHLWNHGLEGWDYFNTPPTAKIESIREVGRDELGESVLAKAPEAMGGLEVKRTYLRTERGEEIYQALAAGVPLEMSFGFDPVRVKYMEGEEKVSVDHWRDLLEVKLYDTTDTNYGMNPATSAVKAQELNEQLELVGKRLSTLLNRFRNGMSERDRTELQKLKTLFVEMDEILAEELSESSRAETRASDLLVSLTDLDQSLAELETFLVR